MKIKKKLIGGYMIVASLVMLAGIVGLMAVKSIEKSVAVVIDLGYAAERCLHGGGDFLTFQ